MNDLISLSKLFDKRIFRIPDYQRGYAWGESQLIDFWEDLLNLTEDRYHYTGMLSLKKLNRSVYSSWKEEKWIIDEKGYEAFHVVDGQQRLTTFIILINSILKFAKSKGIQYLNGDELNEIRNRYIVEFKKPEKILKAYKFGYESDNPSFEYLRHHILEEEQSGTLIETFYTLNLEKAKNFFDDRLIEFYATKGNQGLESLFRKLVNKLQFNIHNIEDDFDVFVAFETMNNRGKKLSYLEILKNRLIYLTTLYSDNILSSEAKEQLRRDINDAWKEVYYQLGRNKKKPLNDDEYLKNHWTLYFKYSRNKGDDYIKFLLGQCFNPKAVYGIKRSCYYDENESFDDEHIPEDSVIYDEMDGKLYPTEIKEYVDSLKNVAKYWYFSHNPSECSSFKKEEIKWLEKLNRIGINYFRTLVVASYINNEVTTEQRIKLFKVIEKFIFLCFRMARYQSSYLSNISYTYARQLMKKEIKIDDIIKFFDDKFVSNIPEALNTFLSKITSSFKNGDGYYSWYDLRYFLFEYEVSLSEKTYIVKLNDWSNFIKNEKDKISIEHIYPQTPTRWYWRNQFRGYTNDEQFYLTNSLGNLLPLSMSINASLQNDEFEVKKKPKGTRLHGYSNGSHAEIEVSRYDDWNPHTILERGLHLLSFMEERWGFTIPEDMKYNLLGLSFMKEERVIPEELEKDNYAEREINDNSEGAIKLSEHLKNKKEEVVDLYNTFIMRLKEAIPSLTEHANNVYIGLKAEHNAYFAEVWIQDSQLKIITHEPSQQKNKIGEYLPESYNWSKMYKIYIKRLGDIDKVINALLDVNQNHEFSNGLENTNQENEVWRLERKENIMNALEPYISSGKIIMLKSSNRYIRFTTPSIRNKVGLIGSGKWSGIEDLIVWEIENKMNDARVTLYIGPGSDENKTKWIEFARNNKTFKVLKGKDWTPIYRKTLFNGDDKNVLDVLKDFFENDLKMINTIFDD